MPAALHSLPLVRLEFSSNGVHPCGVVVIAGNPERGALKYLKLLTEISIRFGGGILGEVPCRQDQIGLTVHTQYLVDHGGQAVACVNSQQSAVSRGRQMRIRQLKHPQWALWFGVGHAG